MKSISRAIILLLLLSFSVEIHSQLGITNYSLHVFGLSTNQNNKLSAEIKTFANVSFDMVQMEIDIFYNFKAKDYHRFSVGLGLNAYPFIGDDHIHGLTIPLALEAYPLPQFKRLSILYEISGMLVVEGGLALRNLFGIRYTFGDSNQDS